MDKTLITAITTILSVTTGWLLNETGLWFRTRRSDRKIKNKVLFVLLDIHHTLSKHDDSDIVDLVTWKIMAEIPEIQRTKETETEMKKLYSLVLSNTSNRITKEKFTAIETSYAQAVGDLSTIDPMMAYMFSDKTRLLQMSDHMELYNQDVLKIFPNENSSIEETIRVTQNTITPELIKEATDQLKTDIITISASLGLITKYKIKRLLKRNSYKEAKEKEQMVDRLIARMKADTQSD